MEEEQEEVISNTLPRFFSPNTFYKDSDSSDEKQEESTYSGTPNKSFEGSKNSSQDNQELKPSQDVIPSSGSSCVEISPIKPSPPIMKRSLNDSRLSSDTPSSSPWQNSSQQVTLLVINVAIFYIRTTKKFFLRNLLERYNHALPKITQKGGRL